MEHNHGDPFAALIATIVSIFNAWIAIISMANAQSILSLIASAIAITSGILAARYYYYAAKEKKQNLKSKP